MHIPIHYRPRDRSCLHWTNFAAAGVIWLAIAAIAYGFAVILL